MCSYSVKSRHDRSLKISDVRVQCIANIDSLSDEVEMINLCKVNSQTKAGILYTVNVICDSCTSDMCVENCCELSCLNLCNHMYQGS